MQKNRQSSNELLLVNEKSLEKILHVYRTIFTYAPAAMLYYDNQAIVHYMNKAASKLFHVNPEKVTGTNLFSFIKHTPLQQAVKKSLSQGYATFEEYFSSDTNQQDTIYCGKFQAIYDESQNILGVIALIFEWDTDRNYKDNELIAQIQAKRYFETAGVMMVSLDQHANIVRINTKGCEILGYHEDEILGKNWFTLCIPKELRREIESVFHQVITKAIPLTEHYENDIVTKSGDRRTISWHNSVISDFEGNIIEVLSTGEDITELKESRIALIEQKLYDPLTGLPNRFMLQDRLQHALILAQEGEEEVALFYIDIDNFNIINDTLGHQKGDEILKECIKRIENIINPTDTLIRFGGDEFIIMQEDIGELNNISYFAQMLLTTFQQPFELGENSHYLTASIGIALFPQDAKKPQKLIQAAETAMNQAKKEGKNQFAFYTKALSDSLYEEMMLENDLRTALDNNEFVLHFQPQLTLDKKEVIGLEALVRWEHPEKGIISPYKFIPAAERSRLILPLGEWIMIQACIMTQKWHQEGLFDGKIAVNVSGIQLEHGDLLKTIDKALEISQLPHSMLEIEITESVLMKNPQRWAAILEEIKRLGISVAIDDFGTGYSSLAYLRIFALDTLKIDKSFVDDLPDDEDACAIAKTIVALAKSLGLQTLAEGIETKEQEVYLNAIGCNYAQGYFYSKPLNTSALEIFLKSIKSRHS